jgi:hypothetical protein
MTKDEALNLALEALDDPAILNGVNNAKFFITQALAQPVQPEQEPVGYVYWVKGHAEGALDVQNLKPGTPLYITPPAAQPAQSLDDLVAEFESTPAGTESMRQGREWLKDLQSVQEPVLMRMPKVGDRIVCFEDESLGEVVSLTAGGSPDITFDDGSRGTYMLSEFAELFGYVTPPAAAQPVQEPTPWRDMVVVSLVREGVNKHRARELADHFAAQPVQEPLEYWNAVEGWVKIDEVREHFEAVNCGTIYKHGGEGRVPLYTAPPQRPWVGLTEFQFAEIYNKWNDTNGSTPWGLNQALEAKLRKLNK